MAAHAAHDDPDAILCAGCDECEWRARHPAIALAQMDPERIDTAWRRAVAWHRGELAPNEGEVALLELINAFALLLSKRNVLRYGTLPGAGTAWDDDELQFARMLCEIVATHEHLNVDALVISTGLKASDINEVFERAHERWERAKCETFRCRTGETS
jgi:hypothetical protein